MRVLANILWLVPFMGIFTALFTFLLGGLLVLLVIPAPIGLGLIQLAKFELAPFSRELVDRKDLEAPKDSAWATYSTIIMILYLPIGCLIALFTVLQIVALFFTIIGIPVALVLAKSLSTYFNPVNKVCVPRGVSEALARQKAEAMVAKEGN